jgi:hypothetical protein
MRGGKCSEGICDGLTVEWAGTQWGVGGTWVRNQVPRRLFIVSASRQWRTKREGTAGTTVTTHRAVGGVPFCTSCYYIALTFCYWNSLYWGHLFLILAHRLRIGYGLEDYQIGFRVPAGIILFSTTCRARTAAQPLSPDNSPQFKAQVKNAYHALSGYGTYCAETRHLTLLPRIFQFIIHHSY